MYKCLKNRWLRILSLAVFITLVTSLFVIGAKPVAVGLFPSPVDKFVHAGFFASLTIIFWFVLGMQSKWIIFISISTVAIADEWHQAYLPGRSADIVDLMVDISAILVVIIFLHRNKN